MKRKAWLWGLVVAGLVGADAGALAQTAAAGESSVVKTDKGQVQGYIRNGVLEFRGIPFGKSVGGDRRWTMPEPPEPWSGVLKAMNFAAPCAQKARYNLTERSDNEDCLALNVTVPKLDGQKRPVIVWIHGGAFVGGSSSLYRLDRLAKQTDAVIVAANYRAGVFGFMPHPAFDPDSNGGLALEDQRLALRWVQNNIAAFGGDPGNVTLAGESAGAASVCMHIIAPEQTTGLFHKAIIQSGACVHKLRDVKERNSFGEAVAKKVGCSDPATVLSCLRTKNAQELIEAGDEAGTGDLMAFAPVKGTKTLPQTGADALRDGNFVKVPVVNGGTRDELRLYVGYAVQEGKSFTAANYKDMLRLYYADKADVIAAQYPVTNYSSAAAAIGSVWTDFRPDIGINHCLYVETAKLMSRHVDVYQSEFSDRNAPTLGVSIPLLPDPGFDLGAAHSSELNYYFPGYSNTSQISAPDLARDQQDMADQMVASWANFVKTGVPTTPGLKEWKRFNDGGSAIRFEPGKIAAFDPAADYQCTFWKGLYPEYFSK
ncbi:carboxylesterase/lipase family protein [Azospirillum sp. sgz301742]